MGRCLGSARHASPRLRPYLETIHVRDLQEAHKLATHFSRKSGPTVAEISRRGFSIPGNSLEEAVLTKIQGMFVPMMVPSAKAITSCILNKIISYSWAFE